MQVVKNPNKFCGKNFKKKVEGGMKKCRSGKVFFVNIDKVRQHQQSVIGKSLICTVWMWEIVQSIVALPQTLTNTQPLLRYT